jgi:cold shock CspA family protein
MVTLDIMVHMAAMHMDTMVGLQPGDLVDMRRRQGMYTITGAQQQQ